MKGICHILFVCIKDVTQHKQECISKYGINRQKNVGTLYPSKESEERYLQAFEYSTLKEVHSFDQASVKYSS